jgi:hypothetical protein
MARRFSTMLPLVWAALSAGALTADTAATLCDKLRVLVSYGAPQRGDASREPDDVRASVDDSSRHVNALLVARHVLVAMHGGAALLRRLLEAFPGDDAVTLQCLKLLNDALMPPDANHQVIVAELVHSSGVVAAIESSLRLGRRAAASWELLLNAAHMLTVVAVGLAHSAAVTSLHPLAFAIREACSAADDDDVKTAISRMLVALYVRGRDEDGAGAAAAAVDMGGTCGDACLVSHCCLMFEPFRRLRLGRHGGVYSWADWHKDRLGRSWRALAATSAASV